MKTFFIIFMILTTVFATSRNLCSPYDEHIKITGNCKDKMKYGSSDDIVVEAITNPYPESVDQVEYFPLRIQEYSDAIKCIKILDLVNNNNGGCPFIIYNGVGHNNVAIRFISQKGKNMMFRVQIYLECPVGSTDPSCQ